MYFVVNWVCFVNNCYQKQTVLVCHGYLLVQNADYRPDTKCRLGTKWRTQGSLGHSLKTSYELFLELDSSRVNAANEWNVELNTRREISYLQATMYYFVYQINTIALYWQEKPTSLMNENKWVDNPRITIVECVGAHF